SSVGNASRESAHGEPPAHHVNPTSSRTPRLRQLNFDGREENWSMFHNDFLTQVHACGMMSYLKDSRDISVHGGGEQISLIGKFFNAEQKPGQDPHAFYHQFNSTV
ncbi:unnamed protein product, partial [Ascophyllum nodosum]